MKTIELRKLPRTGLYTVYARNMGDNNIKHYTFSLAQTIVSEMGLASEIEELKKALEIEEGEAVEIKITQIPYNGHNPGIGDRFDGLLSKDVSDVLLKNDPKVKKALLKRQLNSLFMTRTVGLPVEPKERIVNGLKSVANFFINKANSIASLFGKRYRQDFLKLIDSSTPYLGLLFTPFYIEDNRMTVVDPCTSLTVGFEEDELARASEILLKDLRYLEANGLILGHLKMPSLYLLADNTGSGKNQYVLTCYLFLDYQKLKTKTYKTDLELPKKPFKELLGIDTESFENEVAWLDGIKPINKYNFETVWIGSSATSNKEIREAYENSYLESRDYVNEVAAKNKELINKVHKIESTSEVGRNGLHIMAKFEGSEDVKEVVDKLNEIYEQK